MKKIKGTRPKKSKKKLSGDSRIISEYRDEEMDMENQYMEEYEMEMGEGEGDERDTGRRTPEMENGGRTPIDEWGFNPTLPVKEKKHNKNKNKSKMGHSKDSTGRSNGDSSGNLLTGVGVSDRDSRPFVRPDSRANSRGSLRQSTETSRLPVNLSGLSGFRSATGGDEEQEEEEDYGFDDSPSDNFSK